MGSSARTKSSYLNEITQLQRLLANHQEDLAHYKSMLPTTHTKDACKRDIERKKGDIASVKAKIAALKLQMKNAPKG